MRFRTLFAVFVLSLFVLIPALVFSAPSKKPAGQSAPNPQSLELNEKGADAVKKNDFKTAEELFRKALAVDEGNLTAVFNLAGMYLTNKREDLAVPLLEEYVKKAPKDPGLRDRLGDAYFASQKPALAAESYEKALEFNPKYLGLPKKLATVYILQNRLPDAEKMLLKAIEENPKDGQSLANLSTIFLARGKTDEAVSTAKRGLQVKATSELYITLGSAYEAKKDFKNSLIAFERAQDLGNQTPELKKRIEELKKHAS